MWKTGGRSPRGMDPLRGRATNVRAARGDLRGGPTPVENGVGAHALVSGTLVTSVFYLEPLFAYLLEFRVQLRGILLRAEIGN
jgi:hypothetical protein